MKKCPTCQKTFDDGLRFCQADGTPLVDDVPPVEEAPAFDPYATIVSPGGLPTTAAEDGNEGASGSAGLSSSSIPIDEPEDILEVPQSDPLKTMYASDAEMKEILGSGINESDLGPSEAAAATRPSEAEPPGFGQAAPPPSPFSASSGDSVELEPVAPPVETTQLASEPAFDEAATIIQPMSTGLPAEPPAPMEQWAPPPAPEPMWQNQPVASEQPFSGSSAPAAGESKGLAIGSLVCGILSCLCCLSVITGPAGVIMGYMAKKKAEEEPAVYGGRGLAVAGMITGGIGFVIGVAAIILQVVFGVLGNLGR